VCPGSRAEVVWKGVGSEVSAFGETWRGFAHLRILRRGALMPYSIENTFYREHIPARPCAAVR
jgi:hypothetical protein